MAGGAGPSKITAYLAIIRAPNSIIFDHCKNVRIEGVTIQNSPMWQLVPYYSDNVVIRNVRILAPQHSPNTDAIDPFSSSNLIIDHVYSDVGDDNVAIKSGPINSPGPDDPSRDITITDCTFKHGHGLSIGSELSGGAQNIRAERISFEGTDNGIRVKSNRDRGHDVGNLVFRDITMKDVKNPIIISEYYPKVMPPADEAAQPVQRLTPHFHDIVLENVTATGGGVAGSDCGSAGVAGQERGAEECEDQRRDRHDYRLCRSDRRGRSCNCRERRRHYQNDWSQRHPAVIQLCGQPRQNDSPMRVAFRDEPAMAK